ncbi:MAG: Smr/MutS family protein [Bdellovibrionota bacterium]|jgi:DNA mismatch repair protein MutS2
MAFKLHDEVYVVPAKKIGVIIQDLHNGKFLVAINALKIQCLEEQLLPPDEYRNKRPAIQKPEKTVVKVVKRSFVPKKLDLHGLFVEDALKKLEECLNDCVLSGVHELEIIHGIGTGKVKSAVLKYLRTSPLIRNFKEVEGNPGTTRAFF